MGYLYAYLIIGMLMWLVCLHGDAKWYEDDPVPWSVKLMGGALLLVGWPVIIGMGIYKLYKEKKLGS